MKRRNFIKSSAAAIPALGLSSIVQNKSTVEAPYAFKMNYAPHFGMFESSAGKDHIDQLKFMADNGFKGLEDNGMLARPADLQNKIGAALTKLGMTMGVFVVEGGDNWKTSLATGKKEFIDTFVKTCKASVELAKRVNAKWMTVVPGYFERTLPMDIQTANVIEAFRRGAEVFEPHGLIMVMEPLSDNPDLYLRHATQSYMICKAVNSPSCKILYDIYHMQRNDGHLIPTIEKCWDEIAYFQIGDNPNRKEPTTGEINYKNIFKYIYSRGYKGIMGMEHGNSIPGKEGDQAVIKAYQWSDSF
ncbi:MAG: TIM barrel protein [Saprospiraceae bacterium]